MRVQFHLQKYARRLSSRPLSLDQDADLVLLQRDHVAILSAEWLQIGGGDFLEGFEDDLVAEVALGGDAAEFRLFTCEFILVYSCVEILCLIFECSLSHSLPYDGR